MFLRLALAALILFGVGASASARMTLTGAGPASVAPIVPVFDTYPALAPQAYCGIIKMRSAYTGHALQLALGSNVATTLDVDWVTNAQGVQVADDAAAQAWLAANGNSYAWVKTCYDQSGNGNDYPGNVSGPITAPFYKGVTANNLPAPLTTPPLAEWLGLPSMNFYARNGANASAAVNGTTSFLTIPGSVTYNVTSASFMMAMTLNDQRTTGVTQIQQILLQPPSDALDFINYQGALQFNNGTPLSSGIAPSIDWSVKGFSAGTSLCAYDDITSNCQTNSYSAGAITGGTISGQIASGQSFDGNVTAILGPWSTALTPTEYGQVRDGLKVQLGISATPSCLIVFDGDSIGEGLMGQFSEHHIQRSLARLYNDKAVRCRAYNSSTAGKCVGATSGCTTSPSTMISQFSTTVQPLLSSGSYSKRILSMMGGTNDIALGGASAATASGSVSTYIANARAGTPGVNVIYEGMISRVGVDATCFNFMQAVITAASYDILTGWYNDANMKCQSGGGTNYSNTTYFDPDQIHPANPGHDAGSVYDATALESLF